MAEDCVDRSQGSGKLTGIIRRLGYKAVCLKEEALKNVTLALEEDKELDALQNAVKRLHLKLEEHIL